MSQGNDKFTELWLKEVGGRTKQESLIENPNDVVTELKNIITERDNLKIRCLDLEKKLDITIRALQVYRYDYSRVLDTSHAKLALDEIKE